MIFVTTGSQKFQFDRLLRAVDELVSNAVIQDEVFAQSGYCTYIPENFTALSFMEHDEYEAVLTDSDLVITHGGAGTIINALKLGKKVIAVPRLERFGEHVDDHQVQFIATLGQENYLEPCLDINDLGQAYHTCISTTYRPFVSNNEAFLADLDSILSQNDLGKSSET